MKTVILFFASTVLVFSASAAVVDHTTWDFAIDQTPCSDLQEATAARVQKFLLAHRVPVDVASVTATWQPAYVGMVTESAASLITESEFGHHHNEDCALTVQLNHPQWGIEGHMSASHSGDGMSQQCDSDRNALLALPQTAVAMVLVSGAFAKSCGVQYLQIAPKN